MKTLFTFILTLVGISGYAQQARQNVYFIKNNGVEVKQRDSADYTRIIREPDSGAVLYKLLEYYPNGKARRMGTTSTIDPIKLEGPCTSFYESGTRKNVLNYHKGILANEQTYYYQNGKVSEVRNYPDSLNKNKIIANQNYLLITLNDTSGTPLVTNGSGHQKIYDSKYTKVTGEGDIKNGVKDGEWKFSVGKNDSLLVNETYNNGKFVKGTATSSNGESYTYTQADALPEFNGGVQSFNKFLSRTLRYPAEAQTRNLQGRVNVSFVVEKDGSLTSIKVVGLAPAQVLCDEALRVVKLSPAWNPGIRYGRPIRTVYTVPVVFMLGR